MGRLERRFKRAREKAPEVVLEITPLKQRVHLGGRYDGQPFTVADAAKELGITVEPLTPELVDRLKAAGKIPANSIDRALQHAGSFCEERHSVFFRVD